jgi:hypothetical protein
MGTLEDANSIEPSVIGVIPRPNARSVEREDRIRESSMKHLNAANNNPAERLILRTRQVWEPRLGYRIADDAAGQLADNVSGFFATLVQWALAERLEAANDLSPPTNDADGEVRDGR